MDDFVRQTIERLPLAEATYQVLGYITHDAFLQDVFQRYRGRSYEKAISFPLLVQLIGDALLERDGVALQAFDHAQEAGHLPASREAAYGKLARVPVALSMGLFNEATARLGEVAVEAHQPVPASLEEFETLIIDGKKVKHAAARLKPLRGKRGQLLGGKLLGVLSLKSRVAVSLAAHPDGEVSDAPLLPAAVAAARQRAPGPRLWIADAQLCDLTAPALLAQEGDCYLVRHNRKTKFHPDPRVPARRGTDRRGQAYLEQWGWLGAPGKPRSLYVRHISLQRADGKTVDLVTNLLDADRYPAADLSEAYAARWGIEQVFQQVAEVFSLNHLIGGTPEACVFQAGFCFLLYNIIVVLRGYIAAAQGRAPEEISTENLFTDVQRDLIAWNEVLKLTDTLEFLSPARTAEQVRGRLHTLLDPLWRKRWLKGRANKPRQPPTPHQRLPHGHDSVERILVKAGRRPAARAA